MKLNCGLLAGFSEGVLEASVRKVAGAGFDAIEILCEYPLFWGDNYSKQADLLVRLKKELGLEFTVHAPFTYEFYSHPDPVFRKSLHAMVEKSAQVCDRIGSPVLVVHGGLISSVNFFLSKDRSKAVKIFTDEIKPLVKKHPDVKVCVENLSRPASIGHTVEECKKMLELVPGLGFCWDVPHSYLGDQMDTFMKSGLKFDHVHVTDNDGTEDKHWPLGKGKIPWKRVKDHLSKKSYKGDVVLECMSIPDAIASREHWNNL